MSQHPLKLDTVHHSCKQLGLIRLHALCLLRYPKAWAERAEDARAKERRLRALLHEQRMQQNTMFAARMPF